MGASVIVDTLVGTLVGIASLTSLYVIRKLMLSNYCNKCKMTSSCQSDSGLITIKIGPMSPQDIEIPPIGNKTVDGAIDFIKKNSSSLYGSPNEKLRVIADQIVSRETSPSFRQKGSHPDFDKAYNDLEYDFRRHVTTPSFKPNSNDDFGRSHRSVIAGTSDQYYISNGRSRLNRLTERSVIGDHPIDDCEEHEHEHDDRYIDDLSMVRENRRNNSGNDNANVRRPSRSLELSRKHSDRNSVLATTRRFSDSHIKNLHVDVPPSNRTCQNAPVRRPSRSPPQSSEISPPRSPENSSPPNHRSSMPRYHDR